MILELTIVLVQRLYSTIFLSYSTAPETEIDACDEDEDDDDDDEDDDEDYDDIENEEDNDGEELYDTMQVCFIPLFLMICIFHNSPTKNLAKIQASYDIKLYSGLGLMVVSK